MKKRTGKTEDQNKLLREQILYYQARAHEYDEWFFRQGRYDRGKALNRQWFTEIEQVRQALNTFKPQGNVLEIACGTGLWTKQLLQHADKITALDASSEMLSINRARMQSPRVQYVKADIFDWRPDGQYDVVFFAFWLSHVHPEQFTAFWRLVGNALKPDGRVFFLDSRYDPRSTAKDHRLEGQDAITVKRRLNDGREFRIVKVFYDAAELTAQLRKMGWHFKIMETETYFLYGNGQKHSVQIKQEEWKNGRSK